MAHSFGKRGVASPAQILVFGFAGMILIGAFLLSLPVATADGQPLRFLTRFSQRRPPYALPD